MKKKLFGFLISTLLITVTIIPTVTSFSSPQPNDRGGWSQFMQITPGDGSADDRFGNAVDIEGYDAIVGAYFDDPSAQPNAGSAYIFIYSGGVWMQQAKLVAADAASSNQFGTSVAISGEYAIVGSPQSNDAGTNSGAAYIFYRSGTTWTQQAKLVAADAAAFDYFGKSVAIDGEYAIVGAPGKNSNQGFSYIFKRSGTTWTQNTKIGATASNQLGWSVDINMPCVIMGAYGTNSNTGAAHIYELEGSSWMGKGTLSASDGITMDLFGISVSIDSDYAVCGAPGHDLTYAAEGAAYIFEKPGSGWATMTETQKITASDGESGDTFGFSCKVDGQNIIVAAPEDDEGGLNRGTAYIFKRGTSSWSEDAKIAASDASDADFFGWSVALSNENALCGAYADDNSNGIDAGSAYVFKWSNLAPNIPQITGTTNGKAGVEYDYTFTATDPDGDDVYYWVTWGDSCPAVEWDGPYNSGETVTIAHTYTDQGDYTISAKAKDEYDAESDWGTLEISMPKSKETTDSIFGWTIIRGWVANMKKQGNDLYFRAVRLHYLEITGMEMSTGIIKLKRIRISDMGPDRQLTFGPLGSLTWIFGFCHGGLTEL